MPAASVDTFGIVLAAAAGVDRGAPNLQTKGYTQAEPLELLHARL